MIAAEVWAEVSVTAFAAGSVTSVWAWWYSRKTRRAIEGWHDFVDTVNKTNRMNALRLQSIEGRLVAVDSSLDNHHGQIGHLLQMMQQLRAEVGPLPLQAINQRLDDHETLFGAQDVTNKHLERLARDPFHGQAGEPFPENEAGSFHEPGQEPPR